MFRNRAFSCSIQWSKCVHFSIFCVSLIFFVSFLCCARIFALTISRACRVVFSRASFRRFSNRHYHPSSPEVSSRVSGAWISSQLNQVLDLYYVFFVCVGGCDNIMALILNFFVFYSSVLTLPRSVEVTYLPLRIFKVFFVLNLLPLIWPIISPDSRPPFFIFRRPFLSRRIFFRPSWCRCTIW